MSRTDLLGRMRAYVALPAAEFNHPVRLAALTSEDIRRLHDLALRQPDQWHWPLYYEARVVRRADLLWSHGQVPAGWSILDLRDKLRTVEGRFYTEDGWAVHERTYYRDWPTLIKRARSKTKGTARIHELEIEEPPLRTTTRDLPTELEEEAILQLQRFREDPSVTEFAFLPPDGVHYRVVHLADNKRTVFEFPIALRLQNRLRRLVRAYALETLKGAKDRRGHRIPTRNAVRDYDTPEMAEAMAGLWRAVVTYDATRMTPAGLDAHLIQTVQWDLGDAFAQLSTKSKSTGHSRKLREVVDRTGGSLDEPANPNDTEDGTRIDTIEGTLDGPSSLEGEWPSLPEETTEILLEREVSKRLRDPRDFQILKLRVYGDLSEREIAEALDLSQPTVSRRLKRIAKALKDLAD